MNAGSRGRVWLEESSLFCLPVGVLDCRPQLRGVGTIDAERASCCIGCVLGIWWGAILFGQVLHSVLH